VITADKKQVFTHGYVLNCYYYLFPNYHGSDFTCRNLALEKEDQFMFGLPTYITYVFEKS